MTYAREDFMQADKCGTFHIYARCIRRCFLLGHDEESGKDYSGRKNWIPLRLAALRKTFMIDIFAYGVMSNHYHIILNNRPDLVKNLSTKEVVSRWLLLHPTVAMKDEKRFKPTSTEIAKFIEDFDIDEIRLRLSDISWFMRELNQYIAVKANREEGLTGAFFDGRFKSQYLADDNAVLACMIYIDLNPVRSKVAKSIEDSIFTSGYDRMNAHTAQMNLNALQETKYKEEDSLTYHQKKEIKTEKKIIKNSSWLSPLATNLTKKENKPETNLLQTTTTLTPQPFLSITVEKYLELLDLTGREYHEKKPGIIADKFAPILEAMGFQHEHWMLRIKKYDSWFYRVIGPLASLTDKLISTKQHWFKGVKAWENPKPEPELASA
jgi:hypothetical protein